MASPLPDPRETWLMRFLRVEAHAEAQIRKILVSAADDAAKAAGSLADSERVGAQVRAAQLRTAEAAIRSAIAAAFSAVGNRIEFERESAIAVAIRAGISWDKVLLKLALPRKTYSALLGVQDEIAERNVKSMLRRFTMDRIPLSTQVYKSRQIADGWVQDEVDKAIARGASAKELATKVRTMIRPDTPGGVSYAAMRLARTEINQAYHFAAVEDQAERPWVEQMDWRLSRSHHEIDICDELARLGPYDKDNVPSKRDSHPQCMCYVVPNFPSEDDFIDSLNSGDYDEYLAQKYGI